MLGASYNCPVQQQSVQERTLRSKNRLELTFQHDNIEATVALGLMLT